MADYYSILEKTIAGLPSNTPEIRQAVYKKARAAIETQLRNMNPAPSEDAIGSQLKLLEEAIILIDAENATSEGMAEPLVSQPAIEEPPAPPPEPEPTPAPQPQEMIEPAPQEPVVVDPIPEPVPDTPVVPAAPAPESVAPSAPVPSAPASSVPTSAATVAASVAPVISSSSSAGEPTAPVVSQPQSQVDALSNEVIERAENLADSIPPETVGLEELAVDGGSYSSDTTVEVDPSTKDILEPIIAADAANQGVSGESLDAAFEEKKSGGFGGFLKLLVVLGLIGGGGYALWKNKDVLTELVAGFTTQQETTEQPVPEPEPAPVPEPEPAPEPEPVLEPEPEPEPIPEPEPATNEPEIIEPEIIEPVEPEPEAENETGQQTEAPAPEPEGNTNSAQNGVIPIGEVAYLYEEGTAGSGATRINAAVTWDLRNESIQPGLPAEPVIFGKMDVPDRGLTLDIKINRNVDPAVSASHIIEILFDLPQDFAGKSVESIARFVMKETEEAPGEPLVAVPFKASESRFLIALDNLPQALSINTALLRDASWIDIPLVYGTGKRALLTLEKGGTGERVFGEAFRDWQNR